MRANACGSCHNPDKKKGGLDLTSMSGIMAGGSGGSVVSAGAPGDSRLLKIARQEMEPKMPPDGPKMDDAALALLEQWISGGLPETKESKPAESKPSAAPVIIAKAGKPDGPPPVPHMIPIEPARTVARHGPILALAASPWAPLLAIGGERQITLHATDSLSPLGVLDFPEGGPYVLRFSSDGRWLMAAGGMGARSGRVVVWDILDGRRRIELGKESDVILAADVAPDLSCVTLGGPSRKVKFYTTSDGQCGKELTWHTEWITAAAYAPDGVLVATGDRNGGVGVWEAGTRAEFHTLRGHEKSITALAWRPDGNVLASASEDGGVRLWDMNDGAQLKSWTAHQGGTLDAAWSADANLITGGRDKKVKLWKSDGSALKEFPETADVITKVVFSHDGKRVFAGSFSGAVTVWDVESGQIAGELIPNPPTLAQRLEREQSIIATESGRLPELEKVHAEAVAAKAVVEAALTQATAALQSAEALAREATARRDAKQAVLAKADADFAAMEHRRGEIQGAMQAANADLATHSATVANAQNTEAAAKSARDTANVACEQQRTAMVQATHERDAGPANAEILARFTAVESALTQAEAQATAANMACDQATEAVRLAVAARDAAQALMLTRQDEERKIIAELEAARAAQAVARDEHAKEVAAAEQATRAVEPLQVMARDTSKKLEEHAAAEVKAAVTRAEALARIDHARSAHRRWQAEQICLSARPARERMWQAESAENEAISAIRQAEAILARSQTQRDAARQALINSQPWAELRLFIEQSGLNAARRQLVAAQTHADAKANEQARRAAVFKRFETSYAEAKK